MSRERIRLAHAVGALNMRWTGNNCVQLNPPVYYHLGFRVQ